MCSGKIFHPKLREIVAIIGLILFLVFVILAIFKVVSFFVLELSYPIVIIVFGYLLPKLIKKNEKNKPRNKTDPS